MINKEESKKENVDVLETPTDQTQNLKEPVRFRKPWLFLRRFITKTILFVGGIWLIVTFIAVPYRMGANCMYPSLRTGDLAIFYRLGVINADSVILYKDDSDTLRVGRVIAIPNQTVEFTEGGTYKVNGYVALEKNPYETTVDDYSDYPITLQDDEYFVLTDFRTSGDDSRTLGPINKSQIVGTEIFTLRVREF